MRALDGSPSVELRRAVLFFFRRMPADRGWVEENVRAAEARQARGFRIPLIPADQYADAGESRVDVDEAQIAGREVEFFEIQRIVGDVHLAINAGDFAIRADHRRRVVVQSSAAPFEERRDDDDAEFASDTSDRFGAGAGDRLGESEQLGVFFAAEILRAEEFLKTDDLGAASLGFTDPPDGFFEILVGVDGAAHLD